MLETIVKQEIIFYAMGILVLPGILAKLITYLTVRKMVGAAGEIQKSNHRLMRLVKAKFEHASMISDRVQNVEAFVDKYIYEYKVWGVRLSTWRAIPRKVLWSVSILGVFAIFESYRMEAFGLTTIKYMQWTGIFVLLFLLFGFVANEETGLTAAKNYMVEYLENICVHRYEKANRVDKQAEPQEEEEDDEIVIEIARNVEKEEKVEEKQIENEREMRIRAILEEFLA